MSVPRVYHVSLSPLRRRHWHASEELAAAVEAQLLERPPTQQEIYQFRHTLTRDAVASAIPESRQTLLHVRVAEALEKLRDDRQSATIARHFAAGGDGARAVRYARDGARAAIRVGAYAAAIDLLRLAAT